MFPGNRMQTSVAGKTSAEGLDPPLMFVSKGVGKCLSFSPADDAQAFHPSLFVLDGLKVFGHRSEVLKALAVGYDVTLAVLPRPAPHDLEFLTQLLTQFLTQWAEQEGFRAPSDRVRLDQKADCHNHGRARKNRPGFPGRLKFERDSRSAAIRS